MFELRRLLEKVAAREISVAEAEQLFCAPAVLADAIDRFAVERQVVMCGFDYPEYFNFRGQPVWEWVTQYRFGAPAPVVDCDASHTRREAYRSEIKESISRDRPCLGITITGRGSLTKRGVIANSQVPIAVGVTLNLLGDKQPQPGRP